MGEKRLLNNLIQCLLNEATQAERCNLERIVESIVEDEKSPFNAGYFFRHDQVKETFKFAGIFPNMYDCVGKEIKDELKKSGCKPEAPEPTPGCGLFCYVAKNFKRNSKHDAGYIIAVNDLKKFKKKNRLKEYYIDIPFPGKEVKSEYVFPVYICNGQQTGSGSEKILHAVIVLVSFEKNNIPRSDIKILSDLISLIISNESKEIAKNSFHEFVNTLSNFESVEYSKDEYDKIFKALRKLYVKDEEETLKHCQLKHASLWTLNNVDEQNVFLVKEKNFNFPAGSTDLTNIITNKEIPEEGKPHYFYQFITECKKKIEDTSANVNFEKLIKISSFEDVGRQFYNKKHFAEMCKVSDSDLVVLFPIIPHFGKNQHKYENIGLMALYFDTNTFTYHYNVKFLEVISHKIYENMQIVISKTRRNIRKAIFKDISDTVEKEKNFYNKASCVIKKKIDFRSCLIYLFSDDRKKLELKTKEKLKGFPEIIEIEANDTLSIINSVIHEERSAHRTFDYLKKLRDNQETDPYRIWYSKKFIENGKTEEDMIYSCMIIPIEIAHNKSAGIIICLNNKRNVNTTDKSEESFFSFYDYEIAYIGAEVISVYVELLSHAKKARNTLKKLAHEIPGQVSFMTQTVSLILDEFTWVFESLNYLKRFLANTQDYHQICDEFGKIYKQIDDKREHMLNIIDQHDQAAKRVEVFTEFPRLDKLDVRKEVEELNMKRFLSSIINGLRLNAKNRGLSVEFTLDDRGMRDNLAVHPLFRLAIWNLINNAIQYAHFGTTVHITFENRIDRYEIHVENIGIPIPDDIKDKIFEENFRSKEAKTEFLQGTGLGLTLAAKVVEAHGGRIIPEIRNDICSRNIFGIFEIAKILENLKSEEKRGKYINQKSPKHREYSDFRKELEFSREEERVFDKYKRFSIYKSDRPIRGVIEDYLEMIFDGNENLEILFMEHINIPINYVKFTIKLKKEVR